jgi:hypothetical protein
MAAIRKGDLNTLTPDIVIECNRLISDVFMLFSIAEFEAIPVLTEIQAGLTICSSTAHNLLVCAEWSNKRSLYKAQNQT